MIIRTAVASLVAAVALLVVATPTGAQRPTRRSTSPATPAPSAPAPTPPARTSGAEPASEPEGAQPASAGACSNASSEPGETRGEPTERDMCMALEASFRNADASLQQMQKSSCGGSGRNDPMAAMLCLGSSMVTAGGLPQMSVRSIEKVACVSAAASGKPGFFCDYIASVSSANGNISALAGAAGASVTTRRFVKRGQGWLLMASDANK